MGNGWKSAAVCGLALVGLFAFAGDADAFWGRHRCGHHHQQRCQAAYAPSVGCCDAAPVVEAAPCCNAAPVVEAAPCCDAAPVAVAAPCCDSAPAHHVGYAQQGGCCGGGHHGHLRQHRHHGGGCCGGGHQVGYGGGYPVQASPVYAQPTSGCANCQAPW